MSLFLKEARTTLALAFPIIVGQVSQMLMGVTDSIMVGRLGVIPLAASAFASGVFNVFFVVGLGLLLPVAVLVSREHGAGRDDAGAAWLKHGVILAALASIVEMALMFGLIAWFDRLGQPPEVLVAANAFYILIATSLLPALVFQVLRQFAEALGRPWMPMLIMLAGVALNMVLNWILIYGKLGAPALGLTGAGYATLISRIAVVVVIFLWLRRSPSFRSAWPDTWLGGLRWARFREMLQIGIPAAVMLFFEVGAFMVAALMMGWISAAALAAHQIALSCAAFTFMFPLGLSMAVGMRVGNAVGSGNSAALRTIFAGGILMALVLMSLAAATFAIAGTWLAEAFVTDPEVITLAARLLFVAAIFQLFDGVQVVGSGALRGLSDVRIPAAISFIAYWLLAIPGGYFLGVRGPLGATGIWLSLAAGLAVAAVLLVWRFVALSGPVSSGSDIR